MDNIPKFYIKEEVFSIEDIEFWVKRLAKWKSRDIKGHQDEILKNGGPILIPHMHEFFNLAMSGASLNPRIKASLYLFLKVGIKAIALTIGPL
jgi:hypothetical protein